MVSILPSSGADPIVHTRGVSLPGVCALLCERSARSIIDKPEFVLELTSQWSHFGDELTGYWIAIEAFGPDNS